METQLDLAFMIFGLAFFIFVIRLASRDHRESENRRIMESREFGLGSKRQRKASMFRRK
jgi:hypothetical protein